MPEGAGTSMIRNLRLACGPSVHVYLERDGLRALVTSLDSSDQAESYAERLRALLDEEDTVVITGEPLETQARIIDQKTGWALFLPDDCSFGENFRLPEM